MNIEARQDTERLTYIDSINIRTGTTTAPTRWTRTRSKRVPTLAAEFISRAIAIDRPESV
jgi:hypothetical protein